uniref:Integrin subunit alpha M n=1 Tax=Pipistrellus kuhlii TaxID=59472 RepID=A0A7J7T2E2_PIPKU|nr:integrin subunit alpha M [Pipistrellus kuhlii]
MSQISSCLAGAQVTRIKGTNSADPDFSALPTAPGSSELPCYAAEVISRGRVQTLALGAPRYQHTGRVVMFRQSAGAWELNGDVKGSQIGSYFGASLCSVDVDRDGNSDLVLVGAPHYYEPTRGGRVSVCPLPRGRASWQCQAVLRGEQGHPWGRFGAALTALGDVNGDKLADVAIGAPGEQENRGAVYLFHGTSGLGISPAHSQRIAGSQLSPTLQYFGQSLSGGRDLTMDGLMDLAVGAQGQALLLRSQPVLRVQATMIFMPRELARSVFECRENVVRGLTAGEVSVCLRVQKGTGDRLPPEEIRSSILYDLALDSTRPRPRAVFAETKNSTRRGTRVLGLSQTCETLKLQLPECVEDSVTPVVLRLNFSLEGQPLSSYGNLRPVLAVDAQTLFTASLPFEKNCGNDSVCQDALSISLSFTNLHTLVVGGPRNFNLTVTVRNQGEDSYGTRAAFFYPPGLSYQRVSGVQSRHSWRSWRVNCESDPFAQAGALHSGSCTINQPIFPGNSEVTFNITLDVDSDASLGDRLLLTANVTSENNSPRTNQSEAQLALPVKYAVYMVVASRESSIKFLSFPASTKTSQAISHQYQFNNLGQRGPRVSVVLWIPIRLDQEPVWGDPAAVFSPDLNRTCRQEEREPPRSSFRAELSKAPVLNCSVAVCLRICCALAEPFGGQEGFSVNLTGSLSFGWYIETLHKHLQVVSTAEILLDDPGFVQLPGQEALVRAQTETKVEPFVVQDPVPLIVGSSVGGLVLLALITAAMYKLGFFKRQYKDMMSEAAPEAAPPQ